MATANWRTINVDLYDPESASNFDASSLIPSSAAHNGATTIAPVSIQEIQQLAAQIRQLLRGGDTEGALRGALENAPYGGEGVVKDAHLSTVIEILHQIKASEMSPLLHRIYTSSSPSPSSTSPGGPELLDVLMKYLYKGMAQSSSSSAGGPGVGSRTTTSSKMSPQVTGFSQVGGGRSFGIGGGVGGIGGGGGEGGGQAMSVLLSWHEKLVEVAGAGCIVRVMTDRRTV